MYDALDEKPPTEGHKDDEAVGEQPERVVSDAPRKGHGVVGIGYPEAMVSERRGEDHEDGHHGLQPELAEVFAEQMQGLRHGLPALWAAASPGPPVGRGLELGKVEVGDLDWARAMKISRRVMGSMRGIRGAGKCWWIAAISSGAAFARTKRREPSRISGCHQFEGINAGRADW